MVRLKNRYLLVNILYPDSAGSVSTTEVPDIVSFHQPTTDALTPQLLLKAIRAEVSELFGDYGNGAIAESLTVRYLSPATSTFILRVSRAHYRIAWAALSFMDIVPVKHGKNCVFNVIRVSGTIRKAEEEAIRRARDTILRARRDFGEQRDARLDNIFGKQQETQTPERASDVSMLDRDDTEEEEEISD
ncbi:MAG: hypothetical protein M1818_004261 [Claussenomyces sp. TS43310]|nr:MAG: hypothetical protein M1818_004261 [Claussenomyces sp. TS43310]